MGRFTSKLCNECGEELVPNSAVYDDYGTPQWYCMNEDCDKYWLDN